MSKSHVPDRTAADHERPVKPGDHQDDVPDSTSDISSVPDTGNGVVSDLLPFADVYRSNVGAIFGFLVNRVGYTAAEDLTAETFARAYAAYGRYEDRGVPLRAWLFRIAHNLVVGRARRRDSTDVPLDVDHEIGVDLSRDFDVPLEIREVEAAMDHLSDAQRTVVDLRYFRELSVPETAAVLGIAEDAVRALTYRALVRLRAALGGDP